MNPIFGAILHFFEQETVNGVLSSFCCTFMSENRKFYFISTLISDERNVIFETLYFLFDSGDSNKIK